MKLTFLAVLCAISLMLMAGMASAQQKGDLALGFGTLISTPSSSATGSYAPQSVGGGLYPTFSVDFLLRHHLGVSGEISWRLRQEPLRRLRALPPNLL